MLLSNALKYNLQITPHYFRPALSIIMGLIAISSLWFWPSETFPFQFTAQVVLTFLLLIHTYQQFQQRLCIPVNATLFEDGRWVFHESAGLEKHIHVPLNEPLRLTQKSRVTSRVLWLNIRHAKHPRWFWVFRDEVSDEDYRRLCLAIRFCQQERV